MADYDEGGGLPASTVLAIGALLFVYLFVIEPLMKWANENPLLFTLMLSMAFILVALFALFFVLAKMEDAAAYGRIGGQIAYKGAENAAYEERPIQGFLGKFFGAGRHSPMPSAKPPIKWEPHGLYTYTNAAPASGGKRSEPKGAKAEAAMDFPLLPALAEAINGFKPSGQHPDEFGYCAELREFLKAKFPRLKWESRNQPHLPPLAVGKIAIEVCRHGEGQFAGALVEKCQKYSNSYRELLLVLVEARFREEKYGEMFSGLKKSFDNVALVVKY